MNCKLDTELCNKYPLLYTDRDADCRNTCMCWGFDCMDGWYGIVDRLSAEIEAEISAMSEEERPDYKAVQVKEKFGGLRFYMSAMTLKMHAAIASAEQESYRTCECCGRPGRERGDGWIRTLCDDCDRDRPWRKPRSAQ